MASTRSATASVERVCERDLDERTLRVELVRAFRTAVPFEDYAWLLTDPETTVGSAPLADVRCLPELPRLIGLRYRTTVNRWTMLTGAASLAQATGGDLAQSLVWRELLHRHDVGDVATVVFRDGFGLWGWVDLWRSRSEPAFTEDEIRFLAECAGPVTQALRRAQLRCFADRSSAGGPQGVAVLVLGRPRRAGPDASDDGVPPPPGTSGRRPVAGPSRAFNVARPAPRGRGRVDSHPPSSRVHLHGGRWVTLAGRPDRRRILGWSRHRGHHRADRSRRPARGLRSYRRPRRASPSSSGWSSRAWTVPRSRPGCSSRRTRSRTT